LNVKTRRLWFTSRLNLTPRSGSIGSSGGLLVQKEQNKVSKNTSKPNGNITLEQIGYVVGGVYSGGLYALTAPVTLLDGPLPIVDAAWAVGFTVAVARGSAYGGKVGRVADTALTYL